MMPKRSSPWRAIGGFAALLVLALMAWPVPGGVGVTTAVADESELIKIAPGSYAATGTSPIGKSYDGMVAIEPLGKILAVLWRLGTGDAYKGIGLETGSVFGVAYSTDQPFGLVVYRVDGGHLDGRWTLAVDNGKHVSREVLDGPAGLNGAYTIALGENPSGGTYTGHVEIRPNGATYALQWFTPNAAEIGTGILVDHILVVAYGRSPGIGVVAYRREGDHLHGTWAATLSKQTGIEDLTAKGP